MYSITPYTTASVPHHKTPYTAYKSNPSLPQSPNYLRNSLLEQSISIPLVEHKQPLWSKSLVHSRIARHVLCVHLDALPRPPHHCESVNAGETRCVVAESKVDVTLLAVLFGNVDVENLEDAV